MERFVGNLRKVGTFKLRGFSDENFILKKSIIILPDILQLYKSMIEWNYAENKSFSYGKELYLLKIS